MSNDVPPNGSAAVPGNPDDVTQTLVFRYKDLIGREALVTDAATADSPNPHVLYTIEFRNRRPNLHFRRGQTSTEIATATYHTFSAKLDVRIGGQTLTVRQRHMMSADFVWDASAALGSQPMRWDRQMHFASLEHILLDGQGLPLARMTTKALTMRELCRLEILGRCPPTQAAVDEVVATCLSFLHYLRLRSRAS